MKDFIRDHPIGTKFVIMVIAILLFVGLVAVVWTYPVAILCIPLVILFGGLFYLVGRLFWELANAVYEDLVR